MPFLAVIGLMRLLLEFQLSFPLLRKSLDEELTALNRFLTPCAGPVMAILGGAKISTKFNLIRHLLPTMDYIAVGGHGNTFLAAQEKNIGTSLVEHSFIPKARLLTKRG